MTDLMLDNVILVDKNKILEEANNMKLHGYRLSSMTCEQVGNKFELTYHFDLDYKMKHLRIYVEDGERVISISKVYPAAFMTENEFQDLYGLEYDGLIIDYKGSLYMTPDSPKRPMVTVTP